MSTFKSIGVRLCIILGFVIHSFFSFCRYQSSRYIDCQCAPGFQGLLCEKQVKQLLTSGLASEEQASSRVSRNSCPRKYTRKPTWTSKSALLLKIQKKYVSNCLKITQNVSIQFFNFGIFLQLTLLLSKCKCSSLRSQRWMRLFCDFQTPFTSKM